MDAKILLVGIDISDLKPVRESFISKGNYKFFEAYDIKTAFAILTQTTVDVIIFDFDDINEDKINSVLSLRNSEENSPIVLMGNKIEPFALEILRVFPNLLVLEKPEGLKNILPVTAKLVRGEHVLQRRFKRYATNQKGVFTLLTSGSEFDCQVLNLSKGGALLHVSSLNEKIQGMVKVRVHLDQINKDHILTGKIVWISIAAGGSTIGLQFIDDKDVYSQLLKNL